MEACSMVQKNGVNDFHHYKYITSADVLEKVNASLVKQKIASVVTPELLSLVDVVNNKGNTEHLATVKVEIALLDAESGESMHISGLGSGQDSGDKAVMKAQTAAIKYAFMLSLAISTNDDPEADRKTDEGATDKETFSQAGHRPDFLLCNECQSKITPGIHAVSMKKFGRALCMKCQKKSVVA